MLQVLARSARKQLMRRGPDLPGPVVLVLAAVLAAIAAFYAFTFRVNPDELGVVMRFGKVVRQEPPGLHFRLPYPIDEVRLPKVTRQNITEVGMRTGAATPGSADGVKAVREESLMLTGDENIVDINLVVYWRIQDPLKYLFGIRNPQATVKEVAESTMREVVGQSDIQPILTGARQEAEQAAQQRMQELLDRYSAGIHVDRVQLLKIDPPNPRHRRVPGRAGRGHGQGEAAERRVGLRQPRHSRGTWRCGAHPAGRQGLPAADGC